MTLRVYNFMARIRPTKYNKESKNALRCETSYASSYHPQKHSNEAHTIPHGCTKEEFGLQNIHMRGLMFHLILYKHIRYHKFLGRVRTQYTLRAPLRFLTQGFQFIHIYMITPKSLYLSNKKENTYHPMCHVVLTLSIHRFISIYSRSAKDNSN